MNWKDGKLWRQSAINTLWCLIGCSIGDMGVIAGFQFGAPAVAESQPLQVLPAMWLAGFLAPWPYNYWRLAKHGKSCCHAE